MRPRRGAAVMAGTFLIHLLTAVAPRPTYARMDPLNMIVRQLHKPNMLILLDTSGSLTGVPGGTFDYDKEVGVDCDDGLNCRGGLSIGQCAATTKACATDYQCQSGTCRSGLAACETDDDCQPIAGSCASGHSCYTDSDCPPQTSGSCAVTGSNCSTNKKCTSQLRCTRTSIVCASDIDCDPGLCADSTTTCATATDCPYATSGGTCAFGTTPSGGCRANSDCPLRAKVCSNNPDRTCASVNDCGGICKRERTACTSNSDCRNRSNDYCDFAGRSCSAPTNTCMLPRQTCTVRYTDNRARDLNTCVPDGQPLHGRQR